jgi:hypothetical protein
LVGSLRARSRNHALRLVAFKLTAGAVPSAVRAAVAALFEHSGADLIVHNDLVADAGGGKFPAEVYQRNGALAAHCAKRAELGPVLERLLTSLPAPTQSQTHPSHAALP